MKKFTTAAIAVALLMLIVASSALAASKNFSDKRIYKDRYTSVSSGAKTTADSVNYVSGKFTKINDTSNKDVGYQRVKVTINRGASQVSAVGLIAEKNKARTFTIKNKADYKKGVTLSLTVMGNNPNLDAIVSGQYVY